MKELALIFIIGKENRYSINSLIGAIESLSYNFFGLFILDYRRDNIHISINKISTNFKFLVFAFSFMTHQYWDVENIIRELREKYKDAIFVCGGPHASGKPEAVAELGFDYIFIGEAEKTFRRFLKRVINNAKDGFFKLKNRHNVTFISTDHFINLDEFSPISIKFNRFGPIEISRGCPFQCAYCQTPLIFGRKYRHRSIDKIIEIVKVMVRLEMKDFRFITPNALAYGSDDGVKINLDNVENLLFNVRKAIGKDGRMFFGSFPSEIRPESVSDEAIKIIKKYCNNKNIVIGAQSGSSRVLKLLNRCHTVDNVLNAVEIITANGLGANVDFIFGLPVEEFEDVMATIQLIKRLVKRGARIHAHYFLPLPGTALEKQSLKIFHEYETFISRELLPKGHIFGNWERQKELSNKIHHLLLNS